MRDEYPDPYPQRYQKNIPYGFVKQNGALLMTLKNGEVVFPTLVSADQPVSIVAELGEPHLSEE